MNAIVLGNGRSGKAAAELLRRDGAHVTVLEGDDVWPEGTWNLCVTSPGVPLDHPWQMAARNTGVPVISELQLGVERFRAVGGRMLAVTGSKGKSSVVKLVADAVGGIPCGNYGTPICEVALQPYAWAVVEVSSFQMETTNLHLNTFEAAAVLNLQEDHLDRHKSVAVYHALKRRLLDFATVKIMGTDPTTHKTEDMSLFENSYFDNPILFDNALCAIRLMRVAGLANDEIRAAFVRFEPLPHRMQTVGVYGGVTWIDDSKATSIAALVAGVTMAASRFAGSRIHLIAGGLPKGDDSGLALECLTKWVKKAYLIGQCAQMLEAAWRDVVPCEVCGTLERATNSAARNAVDGDCILLSPGAASFDQFKSYGERGDIFCRCASVQ